MAIIGLLDWDLTRWKQSTVFSLELMKRAHYFREQKDIIEMLYEFRPEMVDVVYINKDYEDYLYPKLIMENEKTRFGGLAISDGNYIPLPNEIEYRRADTSIYQYMMKYYRRTNDAKRIFENMLNAYHVRISMDGVQVDPNWVSQLGPRTGRVQHLIIHDKDVTKIEGAEKVVLELKKRYTPSKIRMGFKFPVKVSTDDRALIWGELPKSTGLSNLYLTHLMEDSTIEKLSLQKQQVTYGIERKNWTIEEFFDGLPHILVHGLYLSQWGTTLQVRFDPSLVGEKWVVLEELLNHYFKAATHYRRELTFSLFTYTKYIFLGLQRDEKIQLFKELQVVSPTFFHYAYNVEVIKYEHPNFVPTMYTWEEVGAAGGYGGFTYRKEQKKKKRRMLEEYSYGDLISPEFVYLE